MKNHMFTFGEARLCGFSLEMPSHEAPEPRAPEAKEAAESSETRERNDALPTVEAALERARADIDKIRKDGAVFNGTLNKINAFAESSKKDLAEPYPWEKNMAA